MDASSEGKNVHSMLRSPFGRMSEKCKRAPGQPGQLLFLSPRGQEKKAVVNQPKQSNETCDAKPQPVPQQKEAFQAMVNRSTPFVKPPLDHEIIEIEKINIDIATYVYNSRVLLLLLLLKEIRISRQMVKRSFTLRDASIAQETRDMADVWFGLIFGNLDNPGVRSESPSCRCDKEQKRYPNTRETGVDATQDDRCQWRENDMKLSEKKDRAGLLSLSLARFRVRWRGFHRTMPSKRFLNHLIVSVSLILCDEPILDWQRLREAIRAPGRVLSSSSARFPHFLVTKVEISIYGAMRNLHAAVEVHSVDTDGRVILDTEIDMF